MDTVFFLGMYPLINKPTRIASHSVTIIDNIFAGQLQSQLISGIVVDDVSDPLPIFCLYDLDCLLLRKHICTFRRKLRDMNIQLLCQYLNVTNWNEHVLQLQDVNVAYGNFIDVFKDKIDNLCPLLKIKINTKRDKPWIRNTLKNSGRKINKLLFFKT